MESRSEDRPAEAPRHCVLGAALALMALTSACATYGSAALTWDGASLLFGFLDTQSVSLPHHRFSVALFQVPALWASKVTSNVRVVELVYCALYTSVPCVSAWASWLAVRATRPRLVVFPLTWLCCGAVAGQLFFVTEALLAVNLAWPLLLVVVTGFSVGRLTWSALGVLLLFGLHPVSGPLLVLVAVSAVVCATAEQARRRELHAAASVLGALGAARIVMAFRDVYERSQADVQLADVWQSLHLPRAAVMAVTALPALVLTMQLAQRKARTLTFGLLLVALVVVLTALLPWAANVQAWRDELNFRFIAPLAALPFFVAALIALRVGRPSAALGLDDQLVCLGGALVFVGVLSVQTRLWFGLRQRLESTLASSESRCVSMNDTPEAALTALRWWTTPSYALLIQGRAPRSLLLAGDDCSREEHAEMIPVNPWYQRQRDTGWFDLRRTGL